MHDGFLKLLMEDNDSLYQTILQYFEVRFINIHSFSNYSVLKFTFITKNPKNKILHANFYLNHRGPFLAISASLCNHNTNRNDIKHL